MALLVEMAGARDGHYKIFRFKKKELVGEKIVWEMEKKEQDGEQDGCNVHTISLYGGV